MEMRALCPDRHIGSHDDLPIAVGSGELHVATTFSLFPSGLLDT